MTPRGELTAWRIYAVIICGMCFGPLVGIALGVFGFPASGEVLFLLAVACAAILLLLLVLGGLLMVVKLFLRPSASLLRGRYWMPYPYWYGWRWHRRWWPL